MSWRGRDEGRGSRWAEEGRRRSPVWEPRASPDRERHRDRDADRDRRERYDHERRRDRRSRSRDRDRRERRSPRRYDKQDLPSAPSPPHISPSDLQNLAERNLDEKHDSTDPMSVTASPGDWVCKCGSFNFKRRVVCYRRQCLSKRSEGVVYGGDAAGGSAESSPGITKRLLFRRLDALTTEEKILEAIKERCSKSLLDSIAGITIGREALTGASKCLAYINFNSIAESSSAYQELLALEPRLQIDCREVVISYYNEPHKVQKQSSSSSADYSSYYAQMASYGSAAQASLSEADRVNAAAAVAQSAISAAHARHLAWPPGALPVFLGQQQAAAATAPTGDGKTVYVAPDVRTFQYDESSGYYYDPASGLYYDGKSQYFFNSQTNQYMYWEGTSCTYIAVTQSQQVEASNQSKAEPAAAVPVKEPEQRKKKDKEDKVKVAKKIAKDMERWARTLNQKKEIARNNYVMEQPLDTAASKGSADIGFSVLGAGPSIPPTTHVREISPPPVVDDFPIKKNPEIVADSDENIIDWSKLTCLLCKRRFPSIDVLTKHKTMSDLHKQNLAEFRNRNDSLPQNNGYRDRAAERRMKFGEDEPILNRKRYEMPEVPPVVSAPPPSVVDTIGGKMLQKMGWSEGRGLGKSEQGRIAPIEAEQRPGLAGLGQKRGIYTPTPGETYRDTVKKLMIARYKEVVGQEEGN